MQLFKSIEESFLEFNSIYRIRSLQLDFAQVISLLPYPACVSLSFTKDPVWNGAIETQLYLSLKRSLGNSISELYDIHYYCH